MKKRKVITNIPTWAIFIIVYSLYWIFKIIVWYNQEPIDLNDEDPPEPNKSKFQQRLGEMAKKK